MKDGISIIIPTYKTPKYLYECIESIKSQITNCEYEIIIGIDNCQITLEHINKHKEFYEGINIYFFDENVGPYIIRNNLVDVSKYEYILFFDSDDLLIEGSLEIFYNFIKEHNYVRIKFKNFEMKSGEMSFTTVETAYGVFGITKTLFDKFVGFENWICNADVEFSDRLKFHNINSERIDSILFYRRIHTDNLTVKDGTNFQSKLRTKLTHLINKKSFDRDWGNPIKIIKNYKNINEIQIT
jgi:glycosyltransferase involved in cell wall biosynthesis